MPILMTVEIINAISALIKTRENIGIHPDNRYIFATQTRMSRKFLHGSDCLNSVVNQLDLKNPNAVKSTQLRKYVATVSQVIDLSESELDWLARHMGHDIAVHREYYRLHDSTLEVAKDSKLLLAVEKGHASKLQGKKLSKIELDVMIAYFFSDKN